MLKYIGGDVDVDFNWVAPEEGENDLQSDKAAREKRWNNHRRLCNQFELVTRRWCASKGKEGGEERRVLQKKLRLSHFDYEPYWLGLWVHHRNGDLPLGNPGMVRWQYPMANGDKIREILGHEDSRKSILRELQEIAVGAPVDFVEARTKELLKEGSWGKWDSCDDLPEPPTGFENGQLKYDGDRAAISIIDVIGVDGPETIDEAKAQAAKQGTEAQKATTTNDAVPQPKPAIQKSSSNAAPASQKSMSNAVPQEKKVAAIERLNEKRAPPQKQPTSKMVNGKSAEPEKVSMFQSLKKKLYA